MRSVVFLYSRLLILLSFVCLITPSSAYGEISAASFKKYSEIPVQISSKVKDTVLNAAVKVSHPAGHSYGSGSYIEINNHYLVLTAAHVVEGMEVLHVKNGYETVVGTVIYRDDKNDIAFLLVPKMRSRIPLSYKKSTSTDLMGESAIYAGYPNSHDLLLFFGRVAGRAGESLIMHSYAWMGSSGSVVVNMKGRIIGVLTAVDVGMFGPNPQIIEDVVWVSSIAKVDDTKLQSILSEI